MNYYVCLLDPTSGGVPETTRHALESVPRSHGLPYHWQWLGGATVMFAGTDVARFFNAVTRPGSWGLGSVRLDNRTDVERWTGANAGDLSDTELVVDAIAQRGASCIPDLLGDFAFLAWHPRTLTGVMACDVFAVRKLYYAKRLHLLAVSSRAEALALGNQYDQQYLAERVAVCEPAPGSTAFAGVKAVPAAGLVLFDENKLTTRRYWSVQTFTTTPPLEADATEAAQECRRLLEISVRRRLTGRADTWAQLSGGMDSSSVVCVAETLTRRGDIAAGLSGTVTYVDTCGTGADEREYSDAVISKWGLCNETIVDAPVWQDSRYEMPSLDQPSGGLVFHPRDRRLCEIVRGAGGQVLLTGTGGDSLFTGNMFFFADWVVCGRLWRAVKEMATRAAIGRASFWELAYRNVLLPLLPRTVQAALVEDTGLMPPWLNQSVARRFGLRVRAAAPSSYAGRVGAKYRDAVATEVAAIVPSLPPGIIEDALDVRHPFLYRPLVEFALRLPPELCVRPYARKWLLREAMRDILPELVRTRVGKGQPYGRLSQSLSAQRALLEPLTMDPILADLGIIDAPRLRSAFVEAQRGRDGREKLCGAVQSTLAIEGWLQLRSGQWPRGQISGASPQPGDFSTLRI